MKNYETKRILYDYKNVLLIKTTHRDKNNGKNFTYTSG